MSSINTINTVNEAVSAVVSTTLEDKSNKNTPLRFITCGSVDDGKSTLIGRLLLDSQAVLQDQLLSASSGGEADLALFTDGLMAEREQGITIDVAYRYFTSQKRKFIIGDTPGHEQYTRNMVTAASTADAAVVLVDATKLIKEGQDSGPLALLSQTRRHTLLVNLLRVPNIIFAVNKLDALDKDNSDTNATVAFARIRAALIAFTEQAGITTGKAIIPISALKGYNVVQDKSDWCQYTGPGLLHYLENLAGVEVEVDLPFAQSIQWIEKFSNSSDTSQSRRILWGRVGAGIAQRGQQIQIFPSKQMATIVQILSHVRSSCETVRAGHGCGIILDREVDVSRGDWLLLHDSKVDAFEPVRGISATVAWMDDETLVMGRTYWMMHGRRWIKAKVTRIRHSLNVNTLEETDVDQLLPNAIGHIDLTLQEPIPALGFNRSRVLGAAILVDPSTNKTSGALLFDKSCIQ
jgi:sulfate adenylyltransferase subunit 1